MGEYQEFVVKVMGAGQKYIDAETVELVLQEQYREDFVEFYVRDHQK